MAIPLKNPLTLTLSPTDPTLAKASARQGAARESIEG